MSEPNPELLKRAVDDRERHPWRYYRLDHDVMKKLLDEQAAKIEKLQVDATPRPGPSAGERELTFASMTEPTIRQMAERFASECALAGQTDYFIKFGQAVAARERERCAQLCEQLSLKPRACTVLHGQDYAAAIRSAAGREA